eukprot:TRINITY_DN15941_c0_g1_i1.p1 TRINITY_DN15941_c0_g1~~TRINITY_DN15941_c0_g1_i1.p1  ORF type:complete len:432 (+),score=63.67 TRINITY_DN15941_c0_g1_i1:25-1296(+)
MEALTDVVDIFEHILRFALGYLPHCRQFRSVCRAWRLAIDRILRVVPSFAINHRVGEMMSLVPFLSAPKLHSIFAFEPWKAATCSISVFDSLAGRSEYLELQHNELVAGHLEYPYSDVSTQHVTWTSAECAHLRLRQHLSAAMDHNIAATLIELIGTLLGHGALLSCRGVYKCMDYSVGYIAGAAVAIRGCEVWTCAIPPELDQMLNASAAAVTEAERQVVVPLSVPQSPARNARSRPRAKRPVSPVSANAALSLSPTRRARSPLSVSSTVSSSVTSTVSSTVTPSLLPGLPPDPAETLLADNDFGNLVDVLRSSSPTPMLRNDEMPSFALPSPSVESRRCSPVVKRDRKAIRNIRILSRRAEERLLPQQLHERLWNSYDAEKQAKLQCEMEAVESCQRVFGFCVRFLDPGFDTVLETVEDML